MRFSFRRLNEAGESSIRELWDGKYKEQALDPQQKKLIEKVRHEFFVREAAQISRCEIETKLGLVPDKKLVLLVLQVLREEGRRIGLKYFL